jgi:ABC-2 type transport system permease protein
MTARTLALSFRLGVRKGLSEPVQVLCSAAILAALVISYGRIFQALPQATVDRLGFSQGQVVWYLVVTECLLMGTGRQFRDMQDTIRTGGIDIMLLRPADFWSLTLAGWCGEHAVRLMLLVPFGLALGLAISGFMPHRAILVLLAVSLMLASVMLMASFLVIGCTALWVAESRPVYFLFQKLIFLLGGLLWPLAFYPDWLQAIAWRTPFPAMVATPGSFMLGTPQGEILRELGMQALWTALFLGLCAAMARAVRRRILD